MSDNYKELPCRRFGRVWKWAFDKKSEPYCPSGYGCSTESKDTSDDVAKIGKDLEELKRDVAWIIQYLLKQNKPVSPPPSLGDYKCFKCGMVWKGVMSYYCSNIDCPIQVKVTSQTSNYDIESLDPDRRTWYYDVNGTKRKKE